MKTMKISKATVPGTLHRWVSIGIAAFLLIGALFAAQPGQPAMAAVAATTCTTTTSGSWTANIWSCPGGPTAADNVVINHEVSLANNQSVNSLTIAADAASGLYGLLRFDAAVTLILSGNFDVAPLGLFDPGNGSTGGTIRFAAGSQAILTHGETIDFWNLSKTSTGMDTLSFDPAVSGNGKVHILNNLTLAGIAGVPLKLRSTQSGAVWQIDPASNVSVQFADVQDSKNVSVDVPDIAIAQGVNSGNNTGWSFSGSSVVVTVGPNPAGYKKPVTITAYVTPEDAEGEIVFSVGDNEIEDCDDTEVLNGKAVCVTQTLPLGKIVISAQFNPGETSTLPLNISSPVEQMIGFAAIYLPLLNQ
jgi:hypothetical protein